MESLVLTEAPTSAHKPAEDDMFQRILRALHIAHPTRSRRPEFPGGDVSDVAPGLFKKMDDVIAPPLTETERDEARVVIDDLVVLLSADEIASFMGRALLDHRGTACTEVIGNALSRMAHEREREDLDQVVRVAV